MEVCSRGGGRLLRQGSHITASSTGAQHARLHAAALWTLLHLVAMLIAQQALESTARYRRMLVNQPAGSTKEGST
jgi:hypothetical protein